MLTAARELLAQHGLADFTLRRVAEQLGVAPPAISWHVGSRDALLIEVVDEVLAQIALPDPAVLPGQDCLRLIAAAIHSAIAREPKLGRVVLDLMPFAPRSIDVSAAILAALAATGLEQPALLHVYNAYIGYVLGFTSVEIAQQSAGLRNPVEAKALERLAAAVTDHPSPHIHALFDARTPPPGASRPGEAVTDTSFSLGLEALLAGYRIGQPAAVPGRPE